MKKLLFAPQDYHLKPNPAFYDAFCREFDCEYYSDGQTADYVFMQSMAITPEQAKATGATIIQWTGDCRLEPLSEVIDTPAHITLLASAIGQQDLYPGSKYLQHAGHDFREVNENANGIVFIGNNYNHFPGAKERGELCEMLGKQIKVYGNGFEPPKYNSVGFIPYADVADIYNDAYIGISSSIFNNIEGYWSNRPLDIMAAGCCCLMRYSPNLEQWFEDGKDCLFYHSNDEAIEIINALTPEKRNRIARHGQVTIKQYHTYDFRVQEIIKYIIEYET